ncbi:MAG: prepilin peptidase [Brotaphodocola sp.]
MWIIKNNQRPFGRTDSTFFASAVFNSECRKCQPYRQRDSFDRFYDGERWCSAEHFCLCIILAGAAWTDFFSGKVKNQWLILGIVLGIWCRSREFFFPAVVFLIPAFLLWYFRMMGAGDGKLMAVIAGFLGFSRGILAVWLGLCMGAVWSICHFWHDQSFRTRLNYLFAYFVRMINYGTIEKYDEWSKNATEKQYRIPLAVCMAAGVYLYLFLEHFWKFL